ncbi:hypothetical protein KJ567_06550, partial [Candidatus Bipolaricaulota bacterium]|nr:hypothetical protein [Candidatus Bipolaricaulota bacterium]
GRIESESEAAESSVRVSGPVRHRVHFGAVYQLLQQIADGLPHERVWILLDEWSEIPIELQPILADLIKRALFPLRGITVKIAAIEQRSRFRAQTAGGGYVGIELGADAAADIDLDDFMVFGNDEELARSFFAELLHRHVLSALEQRDDVIVPGSAASFVQEAFTQRPVFDELVKAAEGVPRDAINIVSYAARVADNSAIGMPNVRQAARRWYLQDKEAAVSANPEARALLNWIIDEVIQGRRARAFLLRQGEPMRSDLIRSLYDARVLHVIKKGVSSRDHAGVRFDVYAIDYGCYVELLTTARAPAGLFEVDGDDVSGFVEVPADDYRSIRRAILDLARFEEERA